MRTALVLVTALLLAAGAEHALGQTSASVQEGLALIQAGDMAGAEASLRGCRPPTPSHSRASRRFLQ